VCVVAVTALWFALYELRSNNNVILRIDECHGSEVTDLDENHGKTFAELSIVIRNRGLCLHDLAASLSFCGEWGAGHLNFPLTRIGRKADSHDEFSRGMVATFTLKSYELDLGDIHMLQGLGSPRERDATLNIWSQGFLAKQFRIGGLRDRLAQRWNRTAYSFNHVFERRTGTNPEGMPVVKMPEIIPYRPTVERQVVNFIVSLERLRSSHKSEQTPTR